jgi:hypothetical protein
MKRKFLGTGKGILGELIFTLALSVVGFAMALLLDLV